jgi:ATP-dependent exoDNAse (exonuclease V) alpha subunit
VSSVDCRNRWKVYIGAHNKLECAKQSDIGNTIRVADEAERLLAISQANRDFLPKKNDDREQEEDQEVKGDERDVAPQQSHLWSKKASLCRG